MSSPNSVKWMVYSPKKLLWFVGDRSCTVLASSQQFFCFVGETLVLLLGENCFLSLQFNLFLTSIRENGIQALGITMALAFAIGVVMIYQMGMILHEYGMGLYSVDLMGRAMLREFGPLITAIVACGRSGSAVTARIGSMKLNEELDALKCLGLSPQRFLVVPTLFGLMISLLLLNVCADLFSMLGGMVMSISLLDIQPADFISRFHYAVNVKHFYFGLLKMPFFACAIALVSTYCGFQVKYSAESLGKQTTKSVVASLFSVIMLDSYFSILFYNYGYAY